ncbi:MAG TPA: class I SAM-dependent methyltransferase [Aridibacter sp.]|nr:class I SAM-dependent methyltransferase [Aridibacter sp.]
MAVTHTEKEESIHDSRFTIHQAKPPKEMQAHTYAIMNRVEDSHWWFVGRRAILESFLRRIVKEVSSQKSEVSEEIGAGPVPARASSEEAGPAGSGFQLSGSKTVGDVGFGIVARDGEGPDSRYRNSQADLSTHHSSRSTEADLSTQHSSLSTKADPSTQHSSPSTQHSSLVTHRSGPRILDVGCGTGANLEMLSEFGEAEGVDVSDEALTICKSKGLAVHKGLAEELPFEDELFDIVTGLDVIEHLDDDIAGLREICRVTKKGGYALVFVPAFMWLWGVQDDVSNHRIRYTRKQIVARMEKAGFTVERATYANITFLLPIFAGRLIMRLTGIKPESENNVNVSALNGFFGKILGSERHFLEHFNFPIGVSVVVVARKI